MGVFRNSVIFISLAILLFGCVSNSPQKNDGKILVVTSFYPLYDFAKNVGGNRVEVASLIPSGVEPHEFEPSPGDMKLLSSSRIFVYNGAGMEPWAGKLLESINNPSIVIVDTSSGIELIKSEANSYEEPSEHEEESERTHHHGDYDPHIWLNPVLAKTQVYAIRDALISADPDGKEYYEANAKKYVKELEILDSDISNVMKNCSKHEILITHATLGYFCKQYGCKQISISGINPEGEPSAKDIAAIIDEAREYNVTAVFFENLIDPKSAETIASEINGEVFVFNSVHGLTEDEAKTGEDYISLMRNNLKNIKKALSCE